MNRIDQQQARTALQRIRDRAKKLHETTPGAVPFNWPALKDCGTTVGSDQGLMLSHVLRSPKLTGGR